METEYFTNFKIIITKCDKRLCSRYYKMRHNLLQSVTGIGKCDKKYTITLCDSYYNVRRNILNISKSNDYKPDLRTYISIFLKVLHAVLYISTALVELLYVLSRCYIKTSNLSFCFFSFSDFRVRQKGVSSTINSIL